jgi:hypothetical protein
MNLLEINKEIIFDGPSHTYKTKNGKEFTSVSKLLDNYKPEFDPQGYIIRRVAQRDGLTINEVRAKWDKIRDDACDRGHSLHRQLEYFIKTGKILNDDFKDVVKQFKKIKFTGKLFSEVQVHSPTFYIAGTTDVVELLDNNEINIGDFKQNKKLDKKSKYRNKLLYPLEDKEECEFQVYTLQINLYSFMLSEHGYKTKNMVLYYMNPETRILESHTIPDAQKDVKLLLNHWKAMSEW